LNLYFKFKKKESLGLTGQKKKDKKMAELVTACNEKEDGYRYIQNFK